MQGQDAKQQPRRNGETAGAPGLQLHYDAWGRLVFIDDDGKQHTGVAVIRAFPLTDPRHGIAICDAQARELMWIEALDKMPVAVRRILEEDLARRQFMPTIQRILSVSAPTEPSEWEVETDRGRTRFLLGSEENVRRLSDQRALIVDAHGVHYLIPDVRELDPVSHRLLERYL